MITCSRSVLRCSPFILLVAAAGCGSTKSRGDAATDGGKDVLCTGAACADLPVVVPDGNSAPDADASLDRADRPSDLPCTGAACADLAVPNADTSPADVPADRADLPTDLPCTGSACADLAIPAVDGRSADSADAPLDRADSNPPERMDAPFDQADDRRDLPGVDVAECPPGTPIECINGYLNSGVDGGFCPPDAGAVQPTCVKGAWSCPWGSIQRRECTARQCPTVLPSGACSVGDGLTCWMYSASGPYYNVICTCNSGTWNCLR